MEFQVVESDVERVLQAVGAGGITTVAWVGRYTLGRTDGALSARRRAGGAWHRYTPLYYRHLSWPATLLAGTGDRDAT